MCFLQHAFIYNGNLYAFTYTLSMFYTTVSHETSICGIELEIFLHFVTQSLTSSPAVLKNMIQLHLCCTSQAYSKGRLIFHLHWE